MRNSYLGLRVAGVAFAASLASALASAGSSEPDDAPYVPSPHSIVAKMLELGGVGPDDYLIDLGSGDGRIVLTAAKLYGARGLGVEIREDLVRRSRRAARSQGVADRVAFVRQDLFDTDISNATVVTVYLLPETLERLRDKLLRELEPGTRVLSHDYPIAGLKAVRVVELEHPAKVDVTGVARTNLYLYQVPAQVAGRWSASFDVDGEPVELEFVQRLGSVRGRAMVGGRAFELADVELTGRRISFTLPGAQARFRGRVSGGAITGTVKSGDGQGTWKANRI